MFFCDDHYTEKKFSCNPVKWVVYWELPGGSELSHGHE